MEQKAEKLYLFLTEEVNGMTDTAPENVRTEILYRYLDKEDFLKRYMSRERTEDDCRLCPYYGKRWSCPPGLPDARSYLEKYQSLCLVALKTAYPADIRERSAKDAAYTRQIREEYYESAKRKLLYALLDLEKRIPESRTLGAGRCILCEHCTREEGRPCRRPEDRRYSITGFGLDFGGMLQDVFGLKLLWAEKGLPEYDVAVAALFLGGKIREN